MQLPPDNTPVGAHTCHDAFRCQCCDRVLCRVCERPMSNVCNEGETGARWCRALACRQAEAHARGCPIEQLPGWSADLEQHERNMAELGHGPLGDRYQLGPPIASTTEDRNVMGAHIVDGEFQSDKYPTCPPGKVPLSVRDPSAQDLLWAYAQRRCTIDAEFSNDLETALRAAGYAPAPVPTASERQVAHAVAHAVTFRELGQQILQYTKDHPDNEALDHGVVVRLRTDTTDSEDLHVGGLRSISIEYGCTDTPALVLDADQEPDDADADQAPDDELDEDDEDEDEDEDEENNENNENDEACRSSSWGIHCHQEGCAEALELARATLRSHERDYDALDYEEADNKDLLPALLAAAVSLGWRLHESVFWCPTHAVRTKEA